MSLVNQWREIEASLPERWADARLLLTVADAQAAESAAAVLSPLAPGRYGNQLRFFCVRRGTPRTRPDGLRRLLARLDEEAIPGTLELVSVTEATPSETVRRGTLAQAWDEALAALPADWSDLYVELELASSDHVERAATLLSPVNPARYGGRSGLRFRCAHSFGYGASPEMVRRCLERLDEHAMRGQVRILRALSDSRPIRTQGPVWYVGGKAV